MGKVLDSLIDERHRQNLVREPMDGRSVKLTLATVKELAREIYPDHFFNPNGPDTKMNAYIAECLAGNGMILGMKIEVTD